MFGVDFHILPHTMKRSVYKAFALAIIVIYCSRLSAQSLEVHNINVGHGDATLIIVRDTAVLANKLRTAGYTVPTERLAMLDSAISHRIPLRNTVSSHRFAPSGDGRQLARHHGRPYTV